VYRTESLTRPTYRGDGLGRDAYIFANNSGLRVDPDKWGTAGKPVWDVNVKQDSHNKVFDILRNAPPNYHHKPPTAI